eukprot:279691_1
MAWSSYREIVILPHIEQELKDTKLEVTQCDNHTYDIVYGFTKEAISDKSSFPPKDIIHLVYSFVGNHFVAAKTKESVNHIMDFISQTQEPLVSHKNRLIVAPGGDEYQVFLCIVLCCCCCCC